MDASYSRCRTNGLAGTAAGRDCQDLMDFCAEPHGPYTISTTKGDRSASDQESCFTLAPSLALAGARATRRAPQMLNRGYANCHDSSNREVCQQVADLCMEESSWPISLATNHGQFTAPKLSTCLTLAAGLGNLGYQLTPAAAAAALAGRSRISPYLSLPQELQKDCPSMAAYVTAHPDSIFWKYLQAYGAPEMIALFKPAGDQAPLVLQNLEVVSRLVTSLDDLRKAVRLNLGFVGQIRQGCREEDFAKLEHIGTLITSLDDIGTKGRQLAEIVQPMCRNNPMLDDDAPTYLRLAPLIRTHGLATFQELVRSGGREALASLTYDDVQRLIASQGFASVKALALAAGKNAADALRALSSAPATDLVSRMKLDAFRETAADVSRRAPESVYALLNKGLPAASAAIKTDEDIKKIGSSLMELALTLSEEKYHRRNFFSQLLILRGLINSAADFDRVARRLVTLQRELGSEAWVLEYVFKNHPPSSIAELEGDPIPLLEKEAATSQNESVQIALAKAYCRAHLYQEAIQSLLAFQGRTGQKSEQLAALRFKCMASMVVYACDAPDPTRIQIGRQTFYTQQQIRQTAIAALASFVQGYGGTSIAARAAILRDGLSQSAFAFKATSTTGAGGVRLTKLEGIANATLAFIKDEMPEVIPGNARFQGNDVIVSNYDGRYTVAFRSAARTIPGNNDALLSARLALPAALFSKLRSITFTGRTEEHAAGDYSGDHINVHIGEPYSTIVHELTHHWDVSITGCEDTAQDPSMLYYNLSWKGVPTAKYIWGGVCTEEGLRKPGVRDGFDWDDFSGWYGLCNRLEDIATAAEEYVCSGAEMRKRVREQMAKGNFEPAAKYLFVRHVMPFKGKEYGVAADSTSFELAEFEASYVAARAGGAGRPEIEAILRKLGSASAAAATTPNPSSQKQPGAQPEKEREGIFDHSWSGVISHTP